MNSPQGKNQKNSKQKVTEVPPKRSAPRVPAPVDYEYWKKMPAWTIKETILLLLAIDPDQIDPDKPEQRQIKRALEDAICQKVGFNNTEQFQQKCREILKITELIKRALDVGELECHPNFEFDPFDPYQKDDDLPVAPEAFIKWALKKDLDVPKELRELLDTPLEKQDEFEKAEGLDQSPKRKVFPCPPDTKWEEIKITLIADNKVRIETPHGKGYYFFHELKMGYRGSGDKPINLWNLLKLFAINHGEISFEDIKEDKDRRSLFSSAKRLDKHLRNLFQIDESIYISSYNKEKKYNTKIFFSDQTKVVREAAEGETDDIQSVIESEIEDITSRPLKDSRDNTYR